MRRLYRYQAEGGAVLILLENDQYEVEVQLFSNMGVMSMVIPQDQAQVLVRAFDLITAVTTQMEAAADKQDGAET